MRSALLVLAFALVAVPARAQATDAGWEPWLGCWTLATENLRDGGSPDSLRSARRPTTVQDGAPQVCVTRPPTGGARFETTVGTQSAIDQTIVADGVTRPVNDAECTGTQRAQWSKSGLRLFSSAEIRCKDDPDVRHVSGLSLIAPNGDWLDIQTVAIGDRESIRIKRYYRDANSPRSDRPTVAASALTIDEVVDAIGKVSHAAVEAALVETSAGFNLTSKTLRELASARVPERIIDLMVALSYPDKFLVQRAQAAGAAPPIYRDPFGFGFGYGYGFGYGSPYYYNSYYGSPYFYEPFGFRGYSAFEGATLIVVDPGGGSVGNAPNGPGRAVNGLGYTRIVPRETVPGPATTTARTASTSDSGSSSPAPSSSSGSSSSGSSSGSSGGSASSGGGYSSSSGSSDSGGRTAVPR